MFFRLSPFISSIIFLLFLVLSLFYSTSPFFGWGICGGVLILLITLKISAGKVRHMLLPILLISGSLPLLSLMDNKIARFGIIFILFTSLYLQLLAQSRLKEFPKDKTSLTIITLVDFIVFFVWSNLIFASFINFSDAIFPLWSMITLTILVTFITSRDILEYSSNAMCEESVDKPDINLASILNSLMTAEIAWGIAFFPFGYRSSAMILFASFYVIYTSTIYFLTKGEKKRKLAKDIIVGFIAIILILVTVKWRYY